MGNILDYNRTKIFETTPAPDIRSHKSPTLDPRLLVNKTVLIKESIIFIMNDYSQSNLPPNTTTKSILNNCLYPWFEFISNENSQSNFSITANVLTPTTTHNSNLITTYNKKLYVDAVQLQALKELKSINLKFNVNQIYKLNNGTPQSVIIPAQGKIGAKVLATNNQSIIHTFFDYV